MTLSFRSLVFLGLSLLLMLTTTFIHAEAPSTSDFSGESLKQTAEAAVAVRRENQKLADQWAAEASDLRSEIHALEAQMETLQWRREKIAVYMKDLENKMATLKKKEQAANEIRNELEPFLDQTLKKLQDFSKNDLPMLTELQSPLLRTTKNALDNADANMVQKTRHLLGATTQALEYGYFPQVDESEIDVEGRHIRVQRLSVGRLALFALSGDGRDAWKWQKETAHYEPIPHFARSIEEVIQITQRTRLVTLVELPVGQPKAPEKEASR
ncbi:conserved hypothetical protein [delta proteobacterium NaphS2]|nr:conserved hypothetical protein [delta proteobacterium NaphS2]